MSAAKTDLPGRELTDAHRDYLVGEGIAAAFVDARVDAGLLRSVGDGDALPDGLSWLPSENRAGILFAWTDAAGDVGWQLRPDKPPVDEGGRASKYLAAAGAGGYGVVRPVRSGPVLVVEGTKQALAAAAALSGDPDSGDELAGCAVIGMTGCWGWSHAGEAVPELVNLCRDREIAIVLDADAQSNRSVYDAGMGLREALSEVATSVKFVRLPGRGTQGLDDLLATLPEEKRRQKMSALWGARSAKPARFRPSTKTGQSAVDGFEPWSPATGELLVSDIVDHLITTRHYAITRGEQLASYRRGRYVVAKAQLAADVLDLLGNQFAKRHLVDIETALRARVHKLGLRIPQFPDEPYASFLNGLLDLRTLEFVPHTPAFLTTRQVPVDWDPDAPADRWVEWATDRMGTQQLVALEESLAQMLDPSTPPSKAPVLFGPTRTGKSTVGRIAMAIAGGDDHVTGVPIQELSDMRYAAMLHGSVLNVCTDLPRAAMRDESGFLRMMGGDPIAADAKYGATFTFVNSALHLFATNEIITISGDPAPYLDRITPLALLKSYAGKADPAIEDALQEQLPGICVRLARAWQARHLRQLEADRQAADGVPKSDRIRVWSPPHPAVLRRFADASDRVRRFVATCCDIGVTRTPDIIALREPGDFGPGPQTRTQLYSAFKLWAETEGSASMGMRGFTDRLMKLPGVEEIRDPATKKRVVNVGVKPREDWGEAASDLDLLAEIFPDEYAAAPTETDFPTVTCIPSAETNAATEPAQTQLDATELTALRMLTDGVYAALSKAAAPALPGADPHALIGSAPVAVLLTDLAPAAGMAGERLRALIRRLDPLLIHAGWLVRERWLAEPGVLNTARRPGFGDREFGSDRVGYSVVRAAHAINPHHVTEAA